jgi:hypothetical protein
MATTKRDDSEVERQIHELGARLRAHRQHPCLLFVSRSVQHSDVLAVRSALGEATGAHLDVIVSSPGGDVEAAYLVARELRRRFAHLAVFVPFRAKSAATLLCLAGDELILGSLGELGPLDQQYDEKQKADGPLSTSRLLPFKAMQQLQHGATEMYDELVGRISQKSGMRLFDACSKAKARSSWTAWSTIIPPTASSSTERRRRSSECPRGAPTPKKQPRSEILQPPRRQKALMDGSFMAKPLKSATAP